MTVANGCATKGLMTGNGFPNGGNCGNRFNTTQRRSMKFAPGQIVTTRAIHARRLENAEFSRFVQLSITRHLEGDYGDVSDDDRVANLNAENKEERILSAYDFLGSSERIWIITEADRSSTTVLFPEEY
jgi:hypothetical protein